MSETNKQLACRWFDEVWNKQRREAITELLNPDSVVHDGADSLRGPEGFYPFYDRMHAAFSNIHVTVHDSFADGDKVCVRWSCSMEHTGPGLGIAPTNKRVSTTGISIIRTNAGKLVEGWQNWDMLSLLQQINNDPKAPTYMAG